MLAKLHLDRKAIVVYLFRQATILACSLSRSTPSLLDDYACHIAHLNVFVCVNWTAEMGKKDECCFYHHLATVS